MPELISRRRPARPSLRRFAAVLLGAVIGLCLLLGAIGLIARGNPSKLFGEGKPGTLISVGLLGTAAFFAWRVAVRLGPVRFARLWTTLAICLAVAAIDDMFKLHERADETILAALGADPEGPLDFLDGLLVLAYLLPIAVALVRGWRPLLTMVWTLRAFALAGAAFLAMVALDIGDDLFVRGDHDEQIVEFLEESAKALAGAALLLATVAALEEPLVERLAARRPGRPPRAA